MSEAARQAFRRGLEYFGEGNPLAALSYFEKAYSLDNSNLVCHSYIALLMATERGQLQKAIAIIEESIRRSPEEAMLYLNLGKLYLKANRKEDAIQVIRKGMGYCNLPEGAALLDSLGTRKKPVFPFLSRDHLLNKYVGILLKKLKLR